MRWSAQMTLSRDERTRKKWRHPIRYHPSSSFCPRQLQDRSGRSRSCDGRGIIQCIDWCLICHWSTSLSLSLSLSFSLSLSALSFCALTLFLRPWKEKGGGREPPNRISISQRRLHDCFLINDRRKKEWGAIGERTMHRRTIIPTQK